MTCKNHIVLFEPQIPQNTGNIARTCAATNSPLHIILPMGFPIDDRKMKRAGLDYWDKLDITYYDSIEEFMSTMDGHLYLISKFAEKVYTEENFRSLNLSNTVCMMVYEALRQQDFTGLDLVHKYEHDKLKE